MNIGIFGDSIAWGAADYERGGWAERLKTYCLGKKEWSHIYNLGVSGENTEGLLKRFSQEASVRNLNAVIFAIGLNDSQYIQKKGNYRVSLDQFEKNISELLAQARKITDEVIFVGLTRVDEKRTTPVEWDSTKNYDNESIERYDAVIRNLCEEENLTFVSMLDAIDPKKSDDGLHPDSSGHEEMFKRVAEVIDTL